MLRHTLSSQILANWARPRCAPLIDSHPGRIASPKALNRISKIVSQSFVLDFTQRIKIRLEGEQYRTRFRQARESLELDADIAL